MAQQHFDFIVLGGGSGGYAAARTARETRENVAIIDDGQPLGGLCILRGCMPSKTLIYSAEILHHAQQGATFGLDIPHAAADMQALQERKRRLVEEFAADRREQLQSDRFTLFRQRGTFTGPDTIQLADGTELSADHFIVATGSVVAVPPVPGLADVPFRTSDDVLELDFIPDKTIVLGGGIVACELAQFLRRIGSRVIQIQRSPRILKEASPEAAKVVETAFRDEGIELFTDTRLEEVTHDGRRFGVTFAHQGKSVTVEAPYLMNALGRRPATDSLGLDAAGVETRKSGHVVCDAMQRSRNPRVYAAGDAAGPHEIVHIAVLQGEIAAKHATGRNPDPVDYDSLLGVVFTDPQVGTVGLGERQLQERGIDFLSAEAPFDDHGKSILMEAKYGYVKIFAAPSSGAILGAECIGKDGGELVHSLAVARTLGATVDQLLKVHWYHPTLSEIWTYPLEDLSEALAQKNGRE